MRVLVLGAGGLGGYFGGRLVQAGPASGAEVTFLVRPRRREQIARDGLRIESPLGDATLDARAVLAEELRPEHDVALLTCKAYDLDGAIDAVAPGLAPGGAVLPVLNGMSHMDALNARFGRDRVLGGVARIGATLTADGVVRHLDTLSDLVWGEQDGTMSPRVRALQAAFAAAPGVKAEAVPDILQQMWQKLCMLGTMASVCSLMRANVGEILRGSAEGRAVFHQAFDSACAVAARNGHPPAEGFVAQIRRLFDREDSTANASMLRDLEAGGRVEADHITGFLLAKAREAGVDATPFAYAYAHLKAYERRREAGRLPG